jgi:hypothetical protein
MTTYFPGQTILLSGPSFDTVAAGDISTGTLVGGGVSRSSAHNCVLVDSTGITHPGISLPSGCTPGDVFEIYGGTGWVFTPSGETFVGTSDPAQYLSNTGALFCKLTDTLWGVA